MLCMPSEMEVNATIDLESEVAEKGRKRAIRIYLVISVVQVLCGLGLFASSSFAIHYHGGGGFPYFSGGFAISLILILSSLLAFRVYNKGPYFTSDEESNKEVLCALNWHRAVSFFMFFVSLFGLAIIWIYGLCLAEETECSYEESFRENKTLAIILFVFGCISLITAGMGVALIRTFSFAFGLVTIPGRRGVLRYVGHHSDVIDELRRQNADMQRQLDNQNSYPSSPPGLQGLTNFGFEPPTPPPYSPTAVNVSCISGQLPVDNSSSGPSVISSDPPKYSEIIECSEVPTEPPPPYSKTTSDTRESDTNL